MGQRRGRPTVCEAGNPRQKVEIENCHDNHFSQSLQYSKPLRQKLNRTVVIALCMSIGFSDRKAYTIARKSSDLGSPQRLTEAQHFAGSAKGFRNTVPIALVRPVNHQECLSSGLFLHSNQAIASYSDWISSQLDSVTSGQIWRSLRTGLWSRSCSEIHGRRRHGTSLEPLRLVRLRGG